MGIEKPLNIPLKETECTAGFYCPANTFQPLYCCPGYYCEKPHLINICPEGYVCPIGSVKPLPCDIFTKCPPGSSNVSRFGLTVFIVIMIVLAAILYRIKSYIQIRKSLKYQSRLMALTQKMEEHMDSDDEEEGDTKTLASFSPRSNVDTTEKNGRVVERRRFDITFKNLGLTLPNGIEVMRNVSGELKAGRSMAIMVPLSP